MELFPTIIRVVVSLAAVLALVWLLGRFAKRRGLGGSVAAEHFAVLGRQPLSRTASIALVRVGETALVVGVAEGSVRLLSTAPLSDVVPGGSVDLTAPTSPAPTSPAPTSPAPTSPAPTSSTPTLPAIRARNADAEPTPTASRARNAVGAGPGAAMSARDATEGATSDAGRTGRRAARPPQTTPAPSALAGSALSPATWNQAVGALRERTTRR